MRISDWSSDVCSSDLVDHPHDRLVQTFLRDMAEIEPSDLLATQPLHRARCLRGTQVATVAKQGGDEAFSWVIDLGFKAGQWSEQSMQVEPLIGLGQQSQYVEDRKSTSLNSSN